MNQRINDTGQGSVFAHFKTTNVQKLLRSTALAVVQTIALWSMSASSASAGLLDSIPILSDIINFKFSLFDNKWLDQIQNNLPVSKIYLGPGPETIKINGEDDERWHVLKGRENNPYTIDTMFGLNGVTAAVLGGSLLIDTKVDLEHVAINLYQPIPDGISVWDNTHVRLNDVSVSTKFLGDKIVGVGTVGLKAYGINQFIEGDGFKTNGIATGIRITASNFTGRLPGAIAPEVNLSNVDINAYNSGRESNGMEILGNYLELQPSAQP